MSFVLTGIVESVGSADAGKIPVLGDTGVLDSSFLPSTALSGVPTGAVQAFAMTTVPSGWLACDGSTVSRTDYADLFSVIGIAFGEGDGSTTFALPNLKDNFVLGLGSTYSSIAASGGEATHLDKSTFLYLCISSNNELLQNERSIQRADNDH